MSARRGTDGGLRAVAVVAANPVVRTTQLAIGLTLTAVNAQLVVLSTYLFQQSGAGAVAAYVATTTIAAALCVSPIVAVASRIGHGRLLRTVGLIAAAGVAGLATTVLVGGPLPLLLALAAVVGAVVNVWRPVVCSLLPALVRTPAELVACTATSSLLEATTVLVGPLLGAGLLLAGPDVALAVTAVLLLAGGIAAGTLPRVAVMPPAAGATTGALRTFLTTPQVTVLTGLTAAQTLVRGALTVAVVAFAVDTLGHSDSSVGVLLGAIGVGGVLGLAPALKIVGSRRLHRAYGLGLVLYGLPLVVTAAVPSFAVALVALAVVGLANDTIDISLFSALPRAVPDRVLPAVLGIVEVVLNIGVATGAGIAAVLVGAFGPQSALLAAGLLLPVLAVAASPALAAFDRRLVHRDGETALLRGTAVFAELPVPVLDSVAARVTASEIAAGTTVMREGEPGESFVVIATGAVTILRGETEVARLGPGDAFGEIALLRDSPRNATAVATEATSLRSLDRESFLAALGCDPRARSVAEDLADRRSGPTSDPLQRPGP